jgi:hypothetical protein
MNNLIDTKTVLLKQVDNPVEKSDRSYGTIIYDDTVLNYYDYHMTLDLKKDCTYHYIDLDNVLPFLDAYEYVTNDYKNAEPVSDIVYKTWKLIFETPIKFKYGDELNINGTVRHCSNIYFDFAPSQIQWRKWKKQTVDYDQYTHYFIFLENEFNFSNGGYGSHMEIKSLFNIEPDGKEYAMIHEIEFYYVKDPHNNIKINDIRKDIFDFNQKNKPKL